MKKYNILIVSGLLFFCSFSFVNGQDNFNKVAQSGLQYLKIGVDAAMVGKGEAGISTVKGVSAMFWNPAGLADLNDKEILFCHNAWIADISMNVAAFGLTLENIGTFGVSLLWMDYGNLYKTSVATTIEESSEFGYVDEGTFSPSDIAVGLAYSKKISEQFSVGGQVRFLYENYGSNRTVTISGEDKNTDNIMSAFCFDIGTLYYPGFKSLAISMAVQNFSPDLKYQQESFSTPLLFKIGASMDLLDFYDENSKSNIMLAIDAIHPRDFSERLNVGLELDYLGMFQVRSGYRFNYDEGNFSAGAGLKYPLANTMQLRLDISYLIMSSGRFSHPLQLTAGLKF
ncbi:MAG: PorV/PorQ family protein [Ignavibacteria bacterium]|nr:PorV/PorQ family protein [Ignavibacteria bacterium]